jgi:hypothetical protein
VVEESQEALDGCHAPRVGRRAADIRAWPELGSQMSDMRGPGLALWHRKGRAHRVAIEDFGAGALRGG